MLTNLGNLWTRLTFLFVLALAWSLPATAGAGSYRINFGDQYKEKVHWWGAAAGSVEGQSCEDLYENGVVRSWYLKERNARDFRKSYSFCRDMESDGELADEFAKISHFSYSGDGDTGNSSVPTDRLPVGVRALFRDAAPYISTKLQDIEMFYNDAASIFAGREDHDRAGSALNRGGWDYDLVCDPGYVMTGLKIKAKHNNVGGANQAEIHAVKIECSLLDYEITVPTTTSSSD